MSFAIGLKVLRRMCEEQKPLDWQKAKININLFNTNEKEAFLWVEAHLRAHHKLPQVETLVANFPDIAQFSTPEPASYYITQLENLFYYQKINQANLESQGILKEDQNAHDKATSVLSNALKAINEQRLRCQIMDVGLEAPGIVTHAYHTQVLNENRVIFGWPYMDEQSSGGQPGDIISFVGRPAAGKTWLSLWTAINNWRGGNNVLFVSMEMNILPIAQRITAMYTKASIGQLKNSAFSKTSLDKFAIRVAAMLNEEAKFFVLDGNLTACVEQIYLLADQLQCSIIVIDGAYLLRHKNLMFNKFARVESNVEDMKKFTSNLGYTTFASWQFNREQAKKSKKSGKQQTDLEDIALSDAIPQVSSIVLGLTQEDGVEVMKQRNVRVMKGRNGEVGQFSIAWDFAVMDFSQQIPSPQGISEHTETLQSL